MTISKENPNVSDRKAEHKAEPGDLRAQANAEPKSAKVIFDKDKGVSQTFELASNLDYMTETDLDAQSRVATREALRYGYGLDERGGPAGYVGPLKPTTGHSTMTRMTRMTRMTNQTGVTKVNQAGVQPYIDKVRLKNSKFDATSKLDAASAQTRKFNSNVRGGNISHSRRLHEDTGSVSGRQTTNIGGQHGKTGKFVTIAHNTSSQMTTSIKFDHGDPSGPGGTIERPIGTNLPEIVTPGKLGLPIDNSFNHDQSRKKYSRMSRNSRGSIQTESPAISKFGFNRNNNQAIRLRDVRGQGVLSDHNDYGHVEAFGANRLRDLYAQQEVRAMKNFERASVQFMKKKPHAKEGREEIGNSRQTGDFGKKVQGSLKLSEAQLSPSAAAKKKAAAEATLSS